MDFKEIISNYLEEEDLLYIDIFMKNGISFNLSKPNAGLTLNVDVLDDFVKIYGDVNDTSRIETYVPYTEISHVNGAFGEEQTQEPAEGE